MVVINRSPVSARAPRFPSPRDRDSPVLVANMLSAGRPIPGHPEVAMLRTRFCELFDIEVPLLQAATWPATAPELVAAVCEAGALGSVGAVFGCLPARGGTTSCRG